MKVLIDELKCTGCSACFNVCPQKCINMLQNEEGFFYPTIDSTNCIDCGACKSVCPVLRDDFADAFNSPVAVAAYNNNRSVIENSSSGGIFTALSEYVISNGGVVYGAAFTDDFNVSHIRVDSIGDIALLKGSKYLQSFLGDALLQVKSDLKSGLKVLFSGTPCQIAGLRSFLKKPYDNLICVDIICHSVPSSLVWQYYLKNAESVIGAEIQQVNFRDKRDNWQQYCMSIKSSSGEYVRKLDENAYMKAFLTGLSTRPSCYSCKFKGQNRGSDITIGDFWGCSDVCPEFVNDRGTSLVLLQTEKGKIIFDCVKNNLNTLMVDHEQALAHNPAYYVAAKPHRNRAEFFSGLASESFDALVERLTLPTAEEIAKLKKNNRPVKRILRKIKRVLHKFIKA
ncbi:MAG: 4Fe-4S dicluster domain-containing protein [Ruminococcaceae bacterium]|nr:4Fe-4S dicluster domain-containing protein [Oscillospiraceae bacterium]